MSCSANAVLFYSQCSEVFNVSFKLIKLQIKCPLHIEGMFNCLIYDGCSKQDNSRWIDSIGHIFIRFAISHCGIVKHLGDVVALRSSEVCSRQRQSDVYWISLLLAVRGCNCIAAGWSNRTCPNVKSVVVHLKFADT